MAAIVSCFMIVAPLTNTSNWLVPLHSIRHKGFQVCQLLWASCVEENSLNSEWQQSLLLWL